jgi:hypothetical protein
LRRVGMDELKRLDNEATNSLIRYVKLNEEYKDKLPKADGSIIKWTLNLEELYEMDELGKKVDKARKEWYEKMRKYLEYKQRSK